ncbi:exodeoxyribonuclease I [Xylophilus rhododendri]|uniref:Exodeoxyribonuclease I n=1 Tax=Xylophilus rhododendri TaxID=2697032 RepID=A0A857JCM4_9BURK|nr:exodeoxyribonuclease I [Xylophilus rhododendri]QHJ00850.1 exodeoxyribonuclease I [Xylophilus rhododendri]
MTDITFLWHDYETFGTNPRRDRPSQFAAIRTDAELREIGEPLMVYCRQTDDYLPDPQSCLITGIVPQTCMERGIAEIEFAGRIEAAFSVPGTIGVGYNTIRFDDEVTRFLFWRNLIDPYAREWQNGCGRWDLLDVVRLAYALRPEGMEWPLKPDGKPSFRLEDLTRANGLVHEAAHDALSDVRATIALARLLREKNPRLFDFALGLRAKDRVAQELGLPTTAQTARPFLHVSGMFAAERGCLAVMWPLAIHPTNRNEVLAWDLSQDPAILATLGIEEIRQRLFTRAADLPEGMSRLSLKSVHLNKSPMVVGNLRTLRPEMAQRWQLDLEQAALHAQAAAALPDMSAIWQEVFKRPASEPADVEEDLYGGFVGNNDRRKLGQLRGMSPGQLASARTGFEDARLEEIVFRFRARNYPDSLTEEEGARWQEHRAARLFEGVGGARTVDDYLAALDVLGEQASEAEDGPDERTETILSALYDYAEAVVPERD